jgi:hypothetical protein
VRNPKRCRSFSCPVCGWTLRYLSYPSLTQPQTPRHFTEENTETPCPGEGQLLVLDPADAQADAEFLRDT